MKKLVVVIALCALAGLAQQKNSGRALGNPRAPIRIDLYSDFECSHCKILHEQTMIPLVNNYVNTGKVYLVRHDFPMPMHPHAKEAARYACAAEKLGKYEVVCDSLFRTQETWSKDGDIAKAALTVLTPAEAGKLRTLAMTPEMMQEIESDMAKGKSENVTGTPTMIITKMIRRYPVAGAVTYPVLSAFLDDIGK